MQSVGIGIGKIYSKKDGRTHGEMYTLMLRQEYIFFMQTV